VNPHFRDMLAVLSAEKAEFLIVGAYALGVHGLLRLTGDLDIWVRPTPENAARVWRALVRFPAPLESMKVEDFCNPDVIFRMGLPPNQIDILMSISGVSFDEAWTNRVQGEMEGVPVFVIGVQDQIQNKRASGRPKDIIDAEWLVRHKLGNQAPPEKID
jgi:hypothetical protein